MKKTITTAFFVIGMIALCTAQRVVKYVDELGDDTFYFVNGFAMIDEEAETGFRLTPHVNENGVLDGTDVKSVGIGICVENSTLIFLFEDGEKFKVTAWSKFDCEGVSYFNFTKTEVEKLTTTKLKTIRFTNGHSFESQTSQVPEEHQECFIEVAKELKEKSYKVITE